DLDALAELQCLYLHKVKEYDCLAQKLSKQTESVSKEVHSELLKHFAKVEKYLISLKIALQKCKEQTNSVPKTNVSKGLSKPVTAQTLPQTARQAVSNTNVLQPGMYRIDNRTTQTRAPQSPQIVRNTNPRVSTSTGVNHKTNVSRPQHRSNQLKDKVVPNNSQVKPKKTQVEEHPRISSISYKTKSVTACNDSLNSRTSNIVQLILFIVDSGCTKHMTSNLKLLCNFVEKFLGTVRFGNDQFAPILGYGDLVQGNVTINRVYYVEGLNHNLFSGNDLLTGNRGFDLYTISLQELTSSTPLCLMANASPTQAWLWHRRISHLNFDYINLLSKKDVVIGLPKLKYVKDQLCSSCELSKAKRSSFKSKAVPSSKRRLNLLHMDLCGPMRVASINGKKYILVIVDDYSRYTWTLFLRSKDETPEVLKEFLTMIQRNLQALVITVRTDRGTKFLNKTLNAFFKEEGIEHQTFTARTPKQNGIVERQNLTLVEVSRTMLSALKLPLFFWAEAIATACYTQNRSIIIPTHDKTAYRIINDRKPLIKHLHIFGCICYITRDGENLDKMKEKGYLCILVGYSTQSKGYRIYNKITRMIVESIHIHFDEIKEMSETSVANDTSADAHVPSQQELNLLFGPLYDEFFNAGSNPQDKQPTTNIQPTLAPSTPTYVHAEENNDDQAKEDHLPDDEFTNPFCPPAHEVSKSSSHNIDVDHVGCIDSRKSTSGGIQFVGDKLVSWMSKKQNCTAMSLAEAEYVALSARCAQVMWMRTQLQDYG
nr:hypothetical protein [Tanacetum cinerariifolium]